ncbi:helix-turn-helix domain-containing protein [Streptomyces radicis]|uniref:XRE family transcriptional regulator n=1 Tax=Streptomyces radicis TaxID=1750517 RepID=A0A3A9W3S9_9ACTN|nr:helix-turn-helix transcriptional regulator [Streptomyces radicis]RKN07911.1 XRE family transcriptional regulator [Streptomyces radicis]RKN20635.1 XRE family transcriptional regulator [Streptomyces radicis]
MGEAMPGSTVPRRQLGRHLRELRTDARLTLKLAARKLEWSEAKMWRIESGLTSTRGHDVQTMCGIYGASEETTKALVGLAKESRARGWWHSFGDIIPEGFDVFSSLEGAASQMSIYQGRLVPALFQTEEYARIIIRAAHPDADEEETERRVRLRMARQSLVTRVTAPPRLRVVLDEALLRRPVGAGTVMAGQLRHLAEVSTLDNVAIRVISTDAGPHPGLISGSFFVLRFPLNGDGKETEPPTVYADRYTGDLYLDRPNEIARYDAAFTDMWNMSLSVEASRSLLTELARTHE